MAERAPIEVHLANHRVGTLYRKPAAVTERIAFRYADEWLAARDAFALDPELFLDARTTTPARSGVFGAFADCAPDRWGRRLMQRRERLDAEAEKRAVRTLSELDYVLGVSDASRMGALRFFDGATYVAPGDDVPPLVRLGDLLAAADRVNQQRESPEELALLLAPGSSLGGARPKASVRDNDGHLAIAKFPQRDDEYSIERWEWVALELARDAGVRVPDAGLVQIAGRDVLLSRRFDRRGDHRVHFASALTLLGLRDGEQASYPEIAEILQREGSQPRRDCHELFRRMAFNICVANVDDHLRNHGFLREAKGWTLSPAYDLNPVPADVAPRVLSTSVNLDDATGSLKLAHSFRLLARELTALGAPAKLVRRARRAARQEVQHARSMGGLARHFGGTYESPRIEPRPLRGLWDLALDNAVEGCVNECPSPRAPAVTP